MIEDKQKNLAQNIIIIIIIYLTANELSLGGSSSVHIYTQTIQSTSQNKQYIEQHKKYIEQHKN